MADADPQADAQPAAIRGSGPARNLVEWHPLFLKHLAECGVFSYAARAIGVHPATVRAHRRSNPAFDEQIKEALRQALALLERDANDRARTWLEPVLCEGRVVFVSVDKDGHIVEDSDPSALPKKVPLMRKVYSDKMMQLRLAALLPEKYGNRMDITQRTKVEAGAAYELARQLLSPSTPPIAAAASNADADDDDVAAAPEGE